MFRNPLEVLWGRPQAKVPVDSARAWRFWMASESLPTLVAAIELRAFESFKKSSLAEPEFRKLHGLSARASKVLLWHLQSLGLLAYDSERKVFSLTSVSRASLLKSSSSQQWLQRVRRMIDHPVTPTSYVQSAVRNQAMVHRFGFEKGKGAALAKIAHDRFALPSIIASVELGVIDLLNERAVDLETISQTTQVAVRYVREMLGYLEHYGMVESKAGKWSLSEAGKTYLVTHESNPYHWGGLFALMTHNPAGPRSLLEAIEKEKKALLAPGTDAMMEHVMSPSLAQVFAKHMHSQGAAAAVAVAQHPVFQSSSAVLDVAGGAGTYSFEIGKQNPRLKVSVLELDPMVQITQQWIRLRRARNVSAIKGNMFHPADWPKAQFDTVFFSHVMHDWNPSKIRSLLRNAYAALPPGGKLVLHEVLVGRGGKQRGIATAFSVTLFKWTEGRQYKAGELMHLLRSAGFSVTAENIVPAHGPSSLIVARKPK